MTNYNILKELLRWIGVLFLVFVLPVFLIRDRFNTERFNHVCLIIVRNFHRKPFDYANVEVSGK